MNPKEYAQALLLEYGTKAKTNAYVNQRIALSIELGVPNNTATIYWNKIKAELKLL